MDGTVQAQARKSFSSVHCPVYLSCVLSSVILIWQVCQSKVFFIQSHFLLIKAKLFGSILHSFCHFTHNSWAWLCEQKWAIFQHCPQKRRWWLWPWHEQRGYLINLTPVITVANDPPMAGHMSIPRLWISWPPVRTLHFSRPPVWTLRCVTAVF